MFWVLQDNLFDEAAFATLINQLERQSVRYQVVKIFDGDVDPMPEITEKELVFCLGATAMAKVAKRQGWFPGYFNENLNYQALLENYGSYMLNASCNVGRFDKLEKVWDEFHIRPVMDDKSFDGKVMKWGDFERWREEILASDGVSSSRSTLSGKDQVVMSPLVKIHAEYRFYVVDGKVITGSLYRLGGAIFYKSEIDEAITKFAQEIVTLWAPNRAFALDIADTPQGLKVIEINAINSAGFYACDMGKFVAAINEMKFD